MSKTKKAQLRDTVFVMITLFSIAVTMVIAGYVHTKIKDGFDDSGLHINESSTALAQFDNVYPAYDNLFFFVIIGFIIMLLISAWFIPSHPVFLFVNVFGILILIFMGAILSNIYEDIIAVDGVDTVATSWFGKTTFALTKLPYIGAMIIFLSTIVMYRKGRTEGMYG